MFIKHIVSYFYDQFVIKSLLEQSLGNFHFRKSDLFAVNTLQFRTILTCLQSLSKQKTSKKKFEIPIPSLLFFCLHMTVIYLSIKENIYWNTTLTNYQLVIVNKCTIILLLDIYSYLFTKNRSNYCNSVMFTYT